MSPAPRWIVPLVLVLVVEAVYLSNGRSIGNIDTVPARYLPFTLIREGNFDFNEFPFLFQSPVVPTVFRERNGRFISIYPPVSGLLATPFYLVPVLLGIDPQSPWVPHLEKIAAATITAASVLFLFLLLRGLAGTAVATWIAAIYAFGTSAFTISGQALWQHGPSQLCLALGLYLVVRGLERPRLLAWSGLVLSVAVVARYTNLLLVLPVLWYLVRHRRRSVAAWLGAASLPAFGLLAYNAVQFGSPAEVSYGKSVVTLASAYWSAPMGYALAGLLVSPICGLFVYSPIFVFSVVGMARVWWTPGAALWRCLTVGPVLVVLLISNWNLWWSYWYYGPRLLSDLAPVLALFLWPAWEWVKGRRIYRGAFVVAAAASVLVHAVGAFGYDGTWYSAPMTMDEDRIWSWRHGPLAYYGARVAAGTLSSVRAGLSGRRKSSSASEGLSASIRLDPISPTQPAAAPLKIRLSARNSGDTIWMPGAGPGGVQIRWQWFDQEQAIKDARGQVPIPRAIFPGETFETTVEMWPPSPAARYVLQIGAAREPEQWFAWRRVPIQVDGSCDFTQVTRAPVAALSDPPRLDILAAKPVYRAGELATFFLALANGHTLRNLVLLIAVLDPQGHLAFVFPDGVFSPVPNPPCHDWLPLALTVTLPPGFRFDDNLPLRLAPRPWPPGRYTWYAALLEPDSVRVVARTSRTFELVSP